MEVVLATSPDSQVPLWELPFWSKNSVVRGAEIEPLNKKSTSVTFPAREYWPLAAFVCMCINIKYQTMAYFLSEFILYLDATTS